MEAQPILLEDLLHLSDFAEGRVKIKFNLWNGSEDPIQVWLNDKDTINKKWLLWHKKQRYFRKGDVAVCLVRVGYDLWLLTTIQRIVNLLDVDDGIGYEGEEIQEFSKYFGRVIVRYHKSHRTSGMQYEPIASELVVNEVLSTDFEDDAFPGYDNVCIDFPKLRRILDVSQGKDDWISALEHQKAVYLITDKATGKLYVGSATGDREMLLQRWRNYADNGHGNNTELKDLVKAKGIEYVASNFQYSILENYNARVDDKYIRGRESWWKKILDTRAHGYNSN